ncbi:MAG: LysE family translocator [Desulfobacterales bacterium]|nr:LysE family translocator [Desulfobacterales bacterium]MDX2513139.1 LysE family translocator [Desulfobacterales bacterium]
MISGIVLGLSAGLSPGPMLTLVISQTLRHGVMEGAKVALAPLLTDTPIVIASLMFLSVFSDMAPALGVISLFGGVYLFSLGLSSLRFKVVGLEEDVDPKSLKKGLMVNFLNPSPYLFWVSIGGPLVLKASSTSLVSAAAFVLPFYMLLVGSKIVVAIISGKSRNLLKSRHFRTVIRTLGLVLIGFGVLFLRDGVRYLSGG